MKRIRARQVDPQLLVAAHVTTSELPRELLNLVTGAGTLAPDIMQVGIRPQSVTGVNIEG